MMEPKQWTSLLFFYSLYLLMGAYVFRFFEIESEKNDVHELLQLQSTLSFVVGNLNDTENKALLVDSITKLENQLGKSLFLPKRYRMIIKDHVKSLEKIDSHMIENQTLVENLKYLGSHQIRDNNASSDDFKLEDILENLWSHEYLGDALFMEEGIWTMWNSFFFAFTVLSTIGYGHMAPRTANGQFFCIFFSIIGVPLNGILFAGLEVIFSSKIIRKIDNKRYESRWILLLDSIWYMIPGLILFMLLPAVIFMSVEKWTYLESFYFAFITLTTIGFGDMVAGYSSSAGGEYLFLYRFGIQLWIVFGLGYFLMIITFIQKVLSSKGIRGFERTIRKKLKKKATVINSNLLKDLLKMREVIETISILKRKSNVDLMNEEDDMNKKISIISMNGTAKKISTSSQDNSAESVFEVQHDASCKSDADQNSLDIFMEIAETILHHSYSRSNSKANELTVGSLSDIGEINMGFEEEKSHRQTPEPPRKVSLFRKLSTWSVHTIPSILNRSESRMSSKDMGENKEKETEHEESPDVIDSLGDLIGRVNDVILSEPIHKRERALSLMAERSVSDLFTLPSRDEIHRKLSLFSHQGHTDYHTKF